MSEDVRMEMLRAVELLQCLKQERSIVVVPTRIIKENVRSDSVSHHVDQSPFPKLFQELLKLWLNVYISDGVDSLRSANAVFILPRLCNMNILIIDVIPSQRSSFSNSASGKREELTEEVGH